MVLDIGTFCKVIAYEIYYPVYSHLRKVYKNTFLPDPGLHTHLVCKQLLNIPQLDTRYYMTHACPVLKREA